MLRKLSALAAGSSVLLVASLAHAQAAGGGFGNQGEFILSADRLFPAFGYSRASEDQAGPLPNGVQKISNSIDSSGIGLAWGGTPAFITGGTGVGAGFAVPNFFTVPRVGLDYTIIPNLTIGGDVALFFTLGGGTSSQTVFTNGSTQTATANAPGTTVFGIAPRAGYILHFTDVVHLWLRGGFSFYVATVKQSTTNGNNQTTTVGTSVNQFAIDLDPQLVITPVPRFGFNVGLTGDIPIAGGHTEFSDGPGGSQSVSAGSSLLFVGVTAGILGWFGG